MKQISLALLASMLIVSCSRGGHKGPEGGGVDGGGGDFIFNSREDVVKAIEHNWKLLQNPGGPNPFLKAHSFLDENMADYKTIKAMLWKITGTRTMGGMAFFAKVPDTEFADYLPKVKLNLNEAGLCNGPGDHKYLGSVTKLDRTGEMCISIYGLMRTPYSALSADLLALLAHEVAHLNGFQEREARLLQKYMLKQMPQITRKDGWFTRYEHMEKFVEQVRSRWPFALCYDFVTKKCLERMEQLEDRVREFKVGLRNPNWGDDINIVHPEKFKNLQLQFEDLRRLILDTFADLKADLEKNSSVRVTDAHMQTTKKIANAILDLEFALADYYFGEIRTSRFEYSRFGPTKVARERRVIDWATGPTTMTDEQSRLIYCENGYIDTGVTMSAPFFPVECDRRQR